MRKKRFENYKLILTIVNYRIRLDSLAPLKFYFNKQEKSFSHQFANDMIIVNTLSSKLILISMWHTEEPAGIREKTRTRKITKSVTTKIAPNLGIRATTGMM